jgi:hypothetical protein
MCPISHEVMRDPVSYADGHSYEQAHIERWFVSNSTSPLTGAVLPTKIVTSNHALRNLIQERQEESRCAVEVDENALPPGGSNSSNAQPKWKITRGSGGRKKKRLAEPEFDYDDYNSVVNCINNYKVDIIDLETKVTQLKEQGKTVKQRHKNGEFSIVVSHPPPSRLLNFIYSQQWRQQSRRYSSCRAASKSGR